MLGQGETMTLEALVPLALAGNRDALDTIVSAIQDKIYYLSLRMLADPDHASDATQEILIKVITNLSSFRGESQLTSWVYRLATNYLITEKKVLERTPALNFDNYQKDLESDLQEPHELKETPEYPTLLNELRISCTLAMLLCLNPKQRMAYILGEIFELSHQEASDILEISPDNFRQQLSRARTKVASFTREACSLVQPQAACSCENKLYGAIARRRITQDSMVFATDAKHSYQEIKQALSETQVALRSQRLQQAVDHYKCPTTLSNIIGLLVDQGVKKYSL